MPTSMSASRTPGWADSPARLPQSVTRGGRARRGGTTSRSSPNDGCSQRTRKNPSHAEAPLPFREAPSDGLAVHAWSRQASAPSAAPCGGANTYIQRAEATATSPGPRERAGLIDAPEIGPDIASRPTVPPIASAAASPTARVSVACDGDDDEHEEERQHDLPDQRLPVGAGWHCRANAAPRRRAVPAREPRPRARPRAEPLSRRRHDSHGKWRVSANAKETAGLRCAPETWPTA